MTTTKDEFLKFIEENRIPWGHYAKTESVLIADWWMKKLDQALLEQRKELGEKGNGLKKIHDENWSPHDLRYNKAITDYQNLIKQ